MRRWEMIPPQMRAGAEQAQYLVNGRWKTDGLLTLAMVFPDWKSGVGIFEYLNGFEFNPNEDSAIELNVDYIGNYSSNKVASRLVHNLWDDESDTLPAAQVQILAGIIKRRYTPKWEVLWNEYAIQPWFSNVNITNDLTHGKLESETFQGSVVDRNLGFDTDTFTPSGKKKITEGGTTKTNIGHQGGYDDDTSYIGDETHEITKGEHEDTDNLAETGDDTISRTGNETHDTEFKGKVKDDGTTSYDDNVFGFNTTAVDGVKSGKGSGKEGNTREFENRADNLTITYNDVADKKEYNSNHDRTLYFAERKDFDKLTYGEGRSDKRSFEYKQGTKDTNDVTHGKTITTSYQEDYKEENKTQYNSSKQREWSNYTHNNRFTGTDKTAIAGYDYRRYSRIQELMALYDNHNLFPFFDMVFDDVDRVLCVPIFK